MSEKLPYEEIIAQQMNDLPLPDENGAWGGMKKLLDEDDDNGVIAPLPAKGCSGIAIMLLLLVLISGGLWFAHKQGWFNKKDTIGNKEKISINKVEDKSIPLLKDSISNNDTTISKNTILNEVEKGSTIIKSDTVSINEQSSSQTINEKKEAENLLQQKKNSSSSTKLVQHVDKPVQGNRTKINYAPDKKQKNTFVVNKKGKLISKISVADQGDDENKKDMNKNEVLSEDITDDSSITRIVKVEKNVTTTSGIDTALINKKTDSTLKAAISKDSSKSGTKKDEKNKERRSYFSTGIALQQQIPLSGQSLVPYSSSGRKGSLADYIPSLYFRWHNQIKKWFLQSEGKYGAPQYAKEVVYRSTSKVIDTAGIFVETTNYRVKKTFYNQLSMSFHYAILPSWSVGTGVVWSKFSGAVSEEEINRRNFQSQNDSLVSKKFVTVKKDSAFKSAIFQLMVESEYKYKRFSFGGRYIYSLQPYLTYSLPTSTSSKKENNNLLQIFVRYELWNSKKKK